MAFNLQNYKNTLINQIIDTSNKYTSYLNNILNKQIIYIKSLNISTIRSMKISCPPLPEQKRIVELISSMDAGISALERLISETKQLRSGLLSDLLSGDHEIPESYDKVMGAA